jgi:hypothetical protein
VAAQGGRQSVEGGRRQVLFGYTNFLSRLVDNFVLIQIKGCFAIGIGYSYIWFGVTVGAVWLGE